MTIALIAGAALVASATPPVPAMPGITHEMHAPATAPTDAPSTPEMPMPPTDVLHPPDHDMVGMDMAAGGTKTAGMKMGDGTSATGSGTSRLPAEATMQGLHRAAGPWMLMLHGYAWGASTDQGGPRGRDMAFVQSMAMIEASRPIGDRLRLELRSMVSLEPLMGQRGYPNLFATGETAHGHPLVDRQHPHDLFMELAARIDRDLGQDRRLFLYAGLPGEPALGPSAFMHRGSARLIPEAPISHHWFDSTHITYGVVTAGYETRTWQIEGSVFNGREPGENRWNIETAPLDSWSARLSLTPDRHWAMQISYGHLVHPEKTHPGDDENRLTASVSYAARGLDLTAGVSRKDRVPGRALDAWFAEGTWDVAACHALFGRAETLANDELFEADPASPLHDRTFRVARFTLGYAYKIPIGKLASLALGASGSAYAKSSALDAAYGKAPKSLTLFAKLALGH